MKHIRYIYPLMGLMLCLMACHRTAPQRPSQRNGNVAKAQDTTVIALLQTNQSLAASADTELVRLIQAQSESFAQAEAGYWMRYVLRASDGEVAHQDEQWTLHMVICTTDSVMLWDTEQTYTIGRQQLPLAVEDVMTQSRHGEQLVLVCPWYTAFGAQGNDYVSAYQNVIINLEIR